MADRDDKPATGDAARELRRLAVNAKAAAYRAKHPDRVKASQYKWRKNNKETWNAYLRSPKIRESCRKNDAARYQNDIEYRLVKGIRRSLRTAARLKNFQPAASALVLLGCSPLELKKHLETLFCQGMEWENYGEWEIDHKVPWAAFDLSNPEQQRLCCHFSNLQPLWKTENRRKQNKLDWPPPRG